MESIFFPVFIALHVIGLAWFLLRRRFGSRSRLPPGPRPLPVIGNLLQLGKKPYETLAQMAKTHGPLMSIHLGRVYTVVVSSPEMAKEVLHRHGQVFSGRPLPHVMTTRGIYKKSMAWAPPGKEWRDKRKFSKEEVFSERSLEGSEALRQEKLQQLVEHVRLHCDRGDVVDIHDALLVTILNLMLTTLFSTRSPDFESSTTKEFKEIVEVIDVVLGAPNLADFFPVLKPLDPQGIKRKAGLQFDRLYEKFERLLNDRLELKKNNQRRQDLLQTLVDIAQAADYSLPIQDIPHLLFVSFK